MSFEPLFLTARVLTASYRIISTTLLLLYIAKRISDEKGVPVTKRQVRKTSRFGWDAPDD